MVRIARVVVPGCPHHVTQRGVRRMDVFDSDEDRLAYLRLLREQAEKHGLDFLAWCLMTNHVHLVVVPEEASSLARGLGEAHKRYTRRVNFRDGSRGYLFQGRFFSCPLGEAQVISAIQYALRNPIRAGLAREAWDYAWSSARSLLGLIEADPLVHDPRRFAKEADWNAMLRSEADDLEPLRRHTRTGRPFGDRAFVENVESITGRALQPRRPGRKARE